MSTSETYRPLLTIREVAERLNVSRSTVRRRVDMGELPAVKLGSGPQAPVRVDLDELDAWLYAFPPRPEGEAVSSRRPSRPSGEA